MGPNAHSRSFAGLSEQKGEKIILKEVYMSV
jgi:hypothetical protein